MMCMISKNAFVKIRALMVLILICAGYAFTACTIDENTYLFKHQTFKTGSWKVASQSMDIIIPEVLCSARPYRYLTSGKFDSSAAASIDNSGNVAITIGRYIEYPCRPEFSVDVPIATGIKISRDEPAAFVALNAALDTLAFITKESDTAISIQKLLRDGSMVSKNTVAISGVKTITGLFANDSGQAGFFITGSNGLLQFVNIASASPVATSYDINISDTIVFANSVYAVSRDGHVFSRSANGTYTSELQLNTPISYADAQTICGAATVAFLADTGWVSIAYLSPFVSIARISELSNGVVLQYSQSGNWVSSYSIIKDSPTSIVATSPVILKVDSTREVKYSFISTDSLLVVMTDSEHNNQLPELIIDNQSVYKSAGFSFVGRGDDILCETGIAKLNSDTVKIVMRPDSVFYESNYLVGVFNSLCNAPAWVRKNVRIGTKWNSRSEFTFTIGSDIIYLKNSMTRVKSILQEHPNFLFNGKSLYCSFKGLQHHPSEISLWTLDGKRITSMIVEPGMQQIMLQMPSYSSVVIARVRFSDGRVYSRSIMPSSF
jgi:hypothetical protein